MDTSILMESLDLIANEVPCIAKLATREERAAVVKWLRAEAEAEAQTYTVQAAEWARRIDNIADCIERGEHRREVASE